MPNKYILVAGGAGFVGSHLCNALIAEGDFVIALDNLSTGNKQNVSGLLKSKNFKFIKGDVINLSKIGFLKKIKISEIYHLASPASPLYYRKNPIATW